jgi:hypothetical protein
MKDTAQLAKLESLKEEAMLLMEKAGYPLENTIAVELNPDLPYMGYTTERIGMSVIVVAGFALQNNMALNLLIHEMSHVYRRHTAHPSHNPQLLTATTTWVIHGKVVESYQEKIIESILNNIQDVYADDISFKIFEKHERLNEFFMSWIHDPITSKTAESRWINAERLVSSAFAQANLERHTIPDTGGKVEKAIDAFLAKCDKKLAEKYLFFKEFMVRMPEKVTEKEFEKMLTLYLSEFLKLTR